MISDLRKHFSDNLMGYFSAEFIPFHLFVEK